MLFLKYRMIILGNAFGAFIDVFRFFNYDLNKDSKLFCHLKECFWDLFWHVHIVQVIYALVQQINWKLFLTAFVFFARLQLLKLHYSWLQFLTFCIDFFLFCIANVMSFQTTYSRYLSVNLKDASFQFLKQFIDSH